jgi:hypothetical protein
MYLFVYALTLLLILGLAAGVIAYVAARRPDNPHARR